MRRSQILSGLRQVLKTYRVPKAYLFGSFARKERRYHDIDIAINPPKGKFSLLDMVGLERELARKSGKKVDVITLRSISPYLKPYIRKDLVLFYEGG